MQFNQWIVHSLFSGTTAVAGDWRLDLFAPGALCRGVPIKERHSAQACDDCASCIDVYLWIV